MSRDPRVSVVIPCFNLGHFVDEAIDSVLAQTYSDFDIVVVDDGSTDEETKRHLASLAQPRTRVIRSDVNRGLSAARNLGIQHSSGSYICALDADDRVDPAWLETSVGLLDNDRELAFVSHWLDAFGDREWQWRPGRCDLAMLVDFNTLNGAALFRREIHTFVGGFDESMREGCEDWEFWLRVTEAGYRGAIVPQVMYHYRQRPDSMSRAMSETDTHLRLYETLVAKHPVSYRRHLLDLTLRRDQTFSELVHNIGALEEEIAFAERVLEERRMELACATARLGRIEANRKLEIDHQVLAERADRLEMDRQRLAERADRLEMDHQRLAERADWLEMDSQRLAERADWLDGERTALIGWAKTLADERDQSLSRALAFEHDALRRIADLEHSWSWRISAPFRRLYDWFRGPWA